MGPLFIVCPRGSADTHTGSHNGQRRARTPLTIGEACLKRILSPRPVSKEWDYRTQMVGWNKTREAEGYFRGFPMRRDEGRVVDPPLVFKTVFRRREESPGWRELGKSAKEKRLGR
ncbi:hypothetical protein TNCV_3288671 [Trichonephila clavipes]|nr:hypothetical protein TNCV_3288671 [Trichonephila clavipes]